MTTSSDQVGGPAARSARGPLDRVSFDEQAGVFESRAGLPDGVAERIADAVFDYAGVGPGDLIVEIGAGTGLIGQWLARPVVRYLGLDNAEAMLGVFRPRLPGHGNATLRHADANQRWPVPDGAARVVFGSRVFQLLDVEHLIGEAVRVGRPDGAVLLQGRLERSPDSPKVRARTKLHELLATRGYTPRPAGRLLRRVLERAVAAGGTPLPPRTVAAWPVTVRPPEVLDDWREKWSMGGITPPADIAAAVLTELAEWAAEVYGDPAELVTTEERYVLEGVRVRPGGRPAAAPPTRSHP
jgi:ubiquinone/menaquinone biosynthesis C-methylase UbiE